MKKEYSSKQRKLWKLKRANVKLGQQRSSLLKNHDDIWSDELNTWTQIGNDWNYYSINKIIKLSEQIGRNSLKIQRLRTLIQQEKESDSI